MALHGEPWRGAVLFEEVVGWVRFRDWVERSWIGTRDQREAFETHALNRWYDMAQQLPDWRVPFDADYAPGLWDHAFRAWWVSRKVQQENSGE